MGNWKRELYRIKNNIRELVGLHEDFTYCFSGDLVVLNGAMIKGKFYCRKRYAIY